jgi:pimeloyl-ACP methyl ester carboxylesterase
MNGKYGYIANSIILLFAATALCTAQGKEPVSNRNLVWTSPSKDSKGSMPIGNGEIGANVWVEENGDLLFYLSKTDAWSENGRLLKLGKVRVTLTPNPLEKGSTFSQTLDVERGEVIVCFKSAEQELNLRFAVDANHPVVAVDIESAQPVAATVSLEHWRTKRRELKGQEAHSAYGLLPAGGEKIAVKPVIVEPDTILTGRKDRVVCYHRNERSKWKANLELQALGDLAAKQVDPLFHRTFGALIEGEGLVSQSDTSLKSAEPAKSIHIAVYPLTAQTETADAWLTLLETNAKRIGAFSRNERRAAHRAWWKEFWERSYIRISAVDNRDKQVVDHINRGYRLQRFVNACGGRGSFPIKFNGSIFTTEASDKGDWNADYRRWGGGYWWQNTRLPYWSMLESGDFDLMKPLFRMYQDNLESRRAATREYYNHDGAFFPETQTFWGSYMECNYGRDRSQLPIGMTLNRFIRYYWQGGLELSLMMLDYHAFTGDEAFARETLLPQASEILTFFDQHWQRDTKGKIRFDPAMALETYREAVNPLVEIVGIQKVCEEMLALPEELTTSAQGKQWKRLISELPPVPMRTVNGKKVLACAESYRGKQNVENPELYAIFPYRRYGIGKPELELARRTFAGRAIKKTGGWQQNAIKAAYLGLADEAAKMVGQNFSSRSREHRFPAMWGPNYDWTPDQCHGSVAMTALQRMLLQYDGHKIHLLPAWPKKWDVDFKLHAPRNSTVECRVRNGAIMEMKVTPASRRGDVVTEWKVAASGTEAAADRHDESRHRSIATSIALFSAATSPYVAGDHEPAAYYSSADLPDAMTFLDGREVKTREDWDARRAEIRDLWCENMIGHYPEEAPALLSAKVVKTNTPADESTRKRVVLTFDTPNKKSFEIEVWEPKSNVDTARSLLLTQPRHYQREKWGEEALRRGYVVCIYPGLDTHHREKAYPGFEAVWKTFKSEYPKATWDSSLGIQAWLAGRTLDYLLDPKYGYRIDNRAVGITGFSRYGKQSIYAAAFDERFTCVVARSSGTPTACPVRFGGRQTFMESVSTADCPKPWLNNKARSFYGRENELPVECNALIACIAPRYVMLDTAYNDGSDPTFGVERSYLKAKKAWTFLSKEANICLNYRKGQHNPVTDEQVRKNLDFMDMAFGRGKAKASDFPEVLLHAFDWQSWKTKQRESDLTMPQQASIRQRIDWMLGEQPTSVEDAGKYHIKTGEELGVPDWSRDRWNPGGIKRVPFSFSGRMHGNIFFDPKRKQYKATVIWLHPWTYSHGSNEGYGVQGTTIYNRLAKEGYKVVMYDQFGFGDHLTDAADFYDKYPHWSRMGRAVHDVSRVVDFLVDGKGITAQPVPPTDPGKIYICGFAYGGMVGLYATALDERISGLACFSGFTPVRTNTDAKPTGGIRQYWEWHALIPKLGLYHQKESTIPYDYDDVLALIAGRKCLIYAPARDRFVDPKDVKSCIEKAKASWQDADALTFERPDDICRFQRTQQDALLRWLETEVIRKEG